MRKEKKTTKLKELQNFSENSRKNRTFFTKKNKRLNEKSWKMVTF